MIYLEPNEKILLEVRKHRFIFLIEALGSIIAVFIPLIFLFGINFFYNIPITMPLFTLFGFLYSGWVLLIWIYFFVVWTDYYLDVWVITNERIIDINQRGIFNREISSFHLNRIQDVTVEISGLIATFLHFGTLHVQTAGEKREFIIKGANKPEEVKGFILRLCKDKYNSR